jgi:hypothetical protein
MRIRRYLPPWVAIDQPELVARPEGTERTPPTIVIEGLDEMVQALLAAQPILGRRHRWSEREE